MQETVEAVSVAYLLIGNVHVKASCDCRDGVAGNSDLGCFEVPLLDIRRTDTYVRLGIVLFMAVLLQYENVSVSFSLSKINGSVKSGVAVEATAEEATFD